MTTFENQLTKNGFHFDSVAVVKERMARLLRIDDMTATCTSTEWWRRPSSRMRINVVVMD
jgi:hypothetical protein